MIEEAIGCAFLGCLSAYVLWRIDVKEKTRN